MSRLSDEQRAFFRLLTEELLPWFWREVAPQHGACLRLGEAYVGDTIGRVDTWLEQATLGVGKAPSVHKRGGGHFKRLAIDLMLDVGGEYVRSGNHPVWRLIGERWESLHPQAFWGGRLKSRDSNHLGWRHGGTA